jgi:dTDP-4-amino-4,6-dideoxygalactose transaminase
MEPVPLLDLKLQYVSIRDEIDQAMDGVVASQGFVLGPVVEHFENAIARHVGSDHAVGCASGSDALILTLAALEIGPGDEVLTSPFSFFASASCAYRVGARPRFADIDPETFALDPQSVASAMTPQTRVILPVHLFGQCAPLDPLLEIAAQHGVPLVEDAAQALGATYRSEARQAVLGAGAGGRAGCFSFFPSKNLGAFGDGGMIVTSDADVAERLRLLRVHGGRQMYEHRYVGWNSRLDALQAAVLEVKLRYLDRWSERRAANAERYDRWLAEQGLVSQGRVRLPGRDARSSHIFNQYTLRVERRDELREHLTRSGIGCSVYYPVPLHLQECFRELGYREGSFPRAEQACREVISLPIYPELTEDQQRRVVGAIAEFYRKS